MVSSFYYHFMTSITEFNFHQSNVHNTILCLWEYSRNSQVSVSVCQLEFRKANWAFHALLLRWSFSCLTSLQKLCCLEIDFPILKHDTESAFLITFMLARDIANNHLVKISCYNKHWLLSERRCVQHYSLPADRLQWPTYMWVKRRCIFSSLLAFSLTSE